MLSSRTKLVAVALVTVLALGAAVYVRAGTTGIISGVVKSAEDGKPLSGVNVFVTGARLTAVTDATGYYVITNVPPGEYEVRAEMVGFANGVSDHVQVTMDATSTVAFDLKQEAIQETEVVVSRPRPMIAADQINTLNLITAAQENLTRTDPTSVNTVPGVLSTLPGVVVEPNGTGLTHIRGGKPEQIGYYIEGIPVTDPNMGTFSDNLFSTGVSKFQVYTGGFGAEFGNALGCVLNEVKKTGDTSSGLRLTTYAGDNYYRNAVAEIGGGTPGGFSYYAGTIMQRNDFSGTPVLRDQAYDDTVVKLVWPGKNDTVTLLGLKGTLKGNFGDCFPFAGDFMRQKYAIVGAVWSHNFDSKSFLTVRPYYIHVDALQSILNNYGVSINAKSNQTGLTAAYTNQLNDKQLLKLGGSVLGSDNSQFTFQGEPWAHNDVDTFQTSFYAEQQVKPWQKWTVSIGGRYDSITYDRTGREYITGDPTYDGALIADETESALMPRLGVSYAQDSKTVWKISWGKYMKFVPANTVQTVYVTPDHPYAEAYQAGIGSTSPQRATAGDISFEKQISDSMALRVTPYYSDYTHLGSLAPDDQNIMRYVDLGKAKSRGIEFLLRKKMDQNWQGWLSYTYARIKADEAGTGDLTYTSWDRRHTVSLVADYTAGRWSHTLRADMGSGLADVYPTAAGAKRAAPYAVLTYGLSLELPKGCVLGDSVNLSIYNLLNNRQVAEYDSGVADTIQGYRFGARSLSMGLSKSF